MIWTSTLWTSSQITTLPPAYFSGWLLRLQQRGEKKALGIPSTSSTSSKYHKLKGIYIYYRTAIYIAVAPMDLDCHHYELWAQEKRWLPLQKDRYYTYEKGQKNNSTLWIVFINRNSLPQPCYTEGRLSAPHSSKL